MSRGPWRRISSPSKDGLTSAWQPPPGWVETGAGVWVPPGYQPNRWELPPVQPITSPEVSYAEFNRCRQSASYCILHWFWTLDVDDPSGAPSFRKFPSYPYLRKFFDEAQAVSNMHVEKSRQMTMSWAWMALFLWDILFHDRWPNLVVSRKEKDVDDGGAASTSDSLLGKVRLMYEHLPPFLFQAFDFRQMVVRNVQRDSWIKGEVPGAAGRGPTYRRALLDEAAYIEHGAALFKAVRQSAKNGTCLNSTPNGKGNIFAYVRFNPKSTFRKLSFWWPDNPLRSKGLYCGSCDWKAVPDSRAKKTPLQQWREHVCAGANLPQPKAPECRSPWYDRVCLDYSDADIASELDISYEKSKRGRVYGAFDTVLHVFDHTAVADRDGKRVGERKMAESMEAYRRRYLRAVLDPHLPIVTAWDFGVADPTWMLLGQILDEELMTVRWVDEYHATDQSWDHYHAQVRRVWAEAWKDVGGTDPMEHYGDPAGRNRESDLGSWITNLASAQPPVVIQYADKTAGGVLEWIDFIHALIRNNRMSFSSMCAGLIDAVGQYRYPTTETGELRVSGATLPVHDEFSHPCDALRYLYRGRWPSRLHSRLKRGISVADIEAITIEERETARETTESEGERGEDKPAWLEYGWFGEM